MRITVDLGSEAARVVAGAASSPFLVRRIENALERYGLILQRTVLSPFTDAEWSLMLEAHAGTISEPAAVIEELQDNIADAITLWELDRKHGVDARGLMARLRALDVAQTVALVDRIEQMRDTVVPLRAR